MAQTKKKNAKKDKLSEVPQQAQATPQPQAQQAHEVPLTAPQQQVPRVNDNSQGGVFKKQKLQPKVKNTPHGIQPSPTTSMNKVTTNIEARIREMQAKLRDNPVWKI